MNLNQSPLTRRAILAGTAGLATPAAAFATISDQQVLSEVGATLNRTAAEIAAGVTPVNYAYAPQYAQRYGADPTGATASDAAFAQMFSVLGTEEYVIDGTFTLTTGNITIPGGATVRWTSGSVVNYTGTGSCFLVSNSKQITLWRPAVTMTGNNAIAFDIAGVWFLQVFDPRITAATGTSGQSAFQIQTSRTGGNNYGAYNIQFFGVQMFGASSGIIEYGIRTLQTPGDSVQVTHFDVYGGWSSYVNYPIYLRETSTFNVVGFTLGQCVDGLNVGANSNNGWLRPGELDCSGYGINFPDSTCQNITVDSPSLAGMATLGLINTTNYAPTYLNVCGEIRLFGSGGAQNYYVSYKSSFTYGQSMVETVNGGGTARAIRTYGDVVGQQLNFVSGISNTTTPANNLRGSGATSSASSTTVDFVTAESDTNYYVSVTPTSGGGVVSSIAKSTTGFTITWSSSVTNTFDWHLIR